MASAIFISFVICIVKALKYKSTNFFAETDSNSVLEYQIRLICFLIDFFLVIYDRTYNEMVVTTETKVGFFPFHKDIKWIGSLPLR
jgi:hypothetical protein